MGMTRRDYYLIADTFRQQIDRRRDFQADRKADPKHIGYSALCLTVWDMGARLAENNPRFDKQRFFKACGLAT